ncbi:hypothetical protein EHT25_23720 [Larkinella rosea]|uniref:Glycosyltransferase RgtA/B/C/D-like domain-containing protein n=2 Tax=Larkinella rosea TaxID=2025312 RepID=A0A3P1BJJ6_9BACT|nr:hypothetical protein EHT25_23720 [Larkinella rosea]
MLILLFNDSWFFIRTLRELGITTYLPPNFVSINGYHLIYMSPFSDQIAWAPQHVLPAIIGAWYFLFVYTNFTKWRFIELTIVWLSCMMWSPFATIGLTPFMVFISWKYRFEVLKDGKTIIHLLLTGLGFLPIAFYLTSSQVISNNKTNMFIWQAGVPEWPVYYLLYVLSNFILWVFFLRRTLATNLLPILWVTLATLCILPLYKIGMWNDLQMRANAPALCILGLFIVQQLVSESITRHWISVAAGLLFFINSISVFKLYAGFFPFDKPQNSIEKPFIKGCTNTLEFLAKTYGGPKAAKQYLMHENSVFQKYLLKKPNASLLQVRSGKLTGSSGN